MCNPADIYAQDVYGRTTLHAVAGGGNLEVVELLLATDAEDADVNAKGCWSGRTPLHNAGRKGNLEIVELLLAKGLDVNVKDSSDWTPLHHAAREGNLEIVKLLLAKGADVNAKAYSGTPLQLAKNSKIISLLISHGARYNTLDRIRSWTVQSSGLVCD